MNEKHIDKRTLEVILLLAYRKTKCENLLLLTDHRYEDLEHVGLHIQIKPVYEWSAELFNSTQL